MARYRGDLHVMNFFCWDEYLAMASAELTYRDSLHDIEARLSAVGGQLHLMGFGSIVARLTPADANDNREWRIYGDFAHTWIATGANCILRRRW